MHATPPALKSQFSSGVNQHGLKPVNMYDFKNPTNLINFGRATTFENLNVRRTSSGVGSAVSFDGRTVGGRFAAFTGVVQNKPFTLTFCRSETAALRICMAKGDSTCDRESRILQACLGRVQPLRGEATKLGLEFKDWFAQNVSDNRTKKPTNRPQDWRHVYAQENKQKTKQQSGIGSMRYPKQLSWDAHNVTPPGFATRSRLPHNH